MQAAVGPAPGPWERLEAACVAHLEAILHDDDYAQVVVRVRPADVGAADDSLVTLRNQYESIFARPDRRAAPVAHAPTGECCA